MTIDSEQNLINSNSATSLGNKLNIFIDTLNVNTIMILGLFIFIFTVMSKGRKILNIFNIQPIIFLLFCSIAIYFFLKKQFTKKIKDVTTSQEFQQKRSVLDKICEKSDGYEKNKLVCDKYTEASENFNSITNVLIKSIN